MIELSRLNRAIYYMPRGGMQTGDPKVTIKLCDAQRIKAEIEDLQRQNAELVAQLVAVKDGGGTGQSPCAKFCESVALKKDFQQLREHADKMKVERDAALANIVQAARAGFNRGFEFRYLNPEFFGNYDELAIESANSIKAYLSSRGE